MMHIGKPRVGITDRHCVPKSLSFAPAAGVGAVALVV
jgi:hypothetical protein